MNNFQAKLQSSNDDMPPIVKFFRNHAKEGQAVFIRGEGNFATSVQLGFHADIVANSFLGFFKDTVGVEVKIRSVKYESFDDLLIETRSCTNPGRESLGWIYTCKADLLCYVNMLRFPQGSMRLRVLDMPKLQTWFPNVNLTQYKAKYTDESNHTESYPIPWKDIPPELVLYAGRIDEEGNEIKPAARVVNFNPPRADGIQRAQQRSYATPKEERAKLTDKERRIIQEGLW